MDIDIVLFSLFIALSFFCSGSETALFSLSAVTIEDLTKKYPKRGQMINYLLSNPEKLLLSIIICNIFVNIFATLTAGTIFSNYTPWLPLWARILAITLIILLVGETTPKSIAIGFNRNTSLIVGPVFYYMSIILTPVIFVMSKIALLFVDINSILFFRHDKKEQYYKAEEMIEVIKSSKTLGIIEESEGDILRNIIEFTETDIWKIMRPRNEMFSISLDSRIDEIISLIKEKKYSRIPVWKDEEENIVGIFYTKEILRFKDSKLPLSHFKKSLREPIFIPETSSAEKILNMFKKTNNHMAIVIDEFGSISGLITLEDILETILGDIVDKEDAIPSYHRYNNSMIEVESKMELTEFNEVFCTELKSEETATIGGYLLERIKRIPKVGEIFILDDLQFKVSGALPHKIERIMVTKLNRFQKKRQKDGL